MMLKYIIAIILMTAFVYTNLLGMFKGYKNIPEGEYKEALWHYKKIELVEKGILCAILSVAILSMGFTDEVALVSLIAMVIILVIENFFGKYMNKAFVCPDCGGPIWGGNFLVILRPRFRCDYCDHVFYTKAQPAASEDSEEDVKELDAADEDGNEE